jgi:hypothetical protein
MITEPIMPSNLNDIHFYYKYFHNYFISADLNKAYDIDLYVMEHLVKQNDSEELWEEWQILTRPIRIQLITAKQNKNIIINNENIPNFLIYNYSGLSHEIQVRYLIEKFPNKKARIIYAVGSPSQKEKVFYANLNITFIHLQCNTNRMHESLDIKLVQLEKAIGSSLITIVTNYVLAFWSSISKANHSYCFYAMRFIPFHISSISKWVTGGSKNNIILNDQEWQTVSRPWIKSIDKFINKNKSNTLKIGSISREGKIDNPQYLSIICNLLKIFPNLEFVLSGRSVRESTINYFKKFNLLNRVIQMGWVEPREGLSAIDFYIEPFPFGGGEMLYQAIANRIPFIYMTNSCSNLFITDAYLKSIFNEKAISMHRANNYSEYFNKSIYIIENFLYYNNSNYWERFEYSKLEPLNDNAFELFTINK